MKRPTTTLGTRNLAKGLVPFIITGLMILAVAALIQAAGYFGHKTNMSRTPDRRSAYPDIAANQTNVALVWSEGYASGSPAVIKHHGPVYLRYTQDIAKSFWSKITVYNSNRSSNNSRDPRVALIPGSPIAHIVWANHDESQGGISVGFNRLLYKTCNLTNGSCSALQAVASTTSANVNFVSPDVAVDGSGKAHVVWARSESGINSVYYRYLNGSSSAQLVASNGSQPAIAVSNGYVHVAWLSGDQIRYKRKLVGSGSWVNPITFSRVRSGNPAIDALNGTVYLVWDHRESGSSDTYAVVYAFSTSNGSSWDNGTASFNLPSGDGTLEFRPSPSDGNSSPGGGYSTGLQPDVALDISGSDILAHVVWHEYKKITGGGEDPTVEYFDIWYSSGNHSLGWTDPEINLTGDSHQHQKWTLEPVIAIGLDDHVHVAYMQTSQDAGTAETWLSDVYYDGYIEATGFYIYLPTVRKSN